MSLVKKSRIFVVEDNLIQQQLIRYTLEQNPDHEVYVFGTGQECLNNLHLNPQIISLDYNLPDMLGAKVLEKIKQYNKNIRVILLSAQQDIDTAVELLRNGADEYLTKGPQMKKRLWHSVGVIKEHLALQEELQELKLELGNKYKLDSLISTSEPMQKIALLVEKAALSNIVVSITGETGTGKEVLARTIHYQSKRKNHKFIAINMAAIPKDLIESELFGHEKGAFTGAETTYQGKFEQANGGTLFLDEIGDLELSLQAKLLRVLQEQEVTRIGSNKTIPFDARIIIATHRNLAEEVRNEHFREDLYYRLLGISIELPPLRKRGRDVLLLAKYFLKQYALDNKMPPKELSQQAKDALLMYNFPGNIRELKSMMELAAVFSDSQKIKKTDLQFQGIQKSFGIEEGELSMNDYCKKIMHDYLKKYDNDVILVSKKLSIGRSTIYKWLKEDSIILK